MTTTTIIPQGHYLAIYDASKRSAPDKIRDACLVYQARFGQVPNVVLVNEAEAGAAVEGVRIEGRGNIQAGNYWVRHEVRDGIASSLCSESS